MNEDRELLEMAAKAAGIKLEWVPTTDGGCHVLWGTCRCWSPLYNDGDALRLAVALNMSVSTGPVEVGANTISGALRNAFFRESRITQDPCAAVRRVIVMAAAEVGRSM